MDQSRNPYQTPEFASVKMPKSTGGGPLGQVLFGVFVRGLGLFFLCTAAVQTFSFLILAMSDHSSDSQGWLVMKYGLSYALPGGVAFFFPNALVRIAYRDEYSHPWEEGPEADDHTPRVAPQPPTDAS